MAHTGGGEVDRRRASDPILEQILLSQRETQADVRGLVQKINDREVADALLRQEVKDLKLDVCGVDGEGGLKATVANHDDKIKIAYAVSTVLVFVGGVIGWFVDKLLKFKGV